MGRKLTCIKKIREVWPANFRTQLINKGLRLPLESYDGIFFKSVMIAVREDLTIDEFADEDLKWFRNDPLTRNEYRASAQALASWNSRDRHVTNIDLENNLLFRREEARKQRVDGSTAQGSPWRKGSQLPRPLRESSKHLRHCGVHRGTLACHLLPL
jgi:hypothetical protein